MPGPLQAAADYFAAQPLGAAPSAAGHFAIQQIWYVFSCFCGAEVGWGGFLNFLGILLWVWEEPKTKQICKEIQGRSWTLKILWQKSGIGS